VILRLAILLQYLESEAPEPYTQEGHSTFQSGWGQEEHRVRAPVNAQRYKLIVLFVKNSHNVAL